ncbi:MAG: biotin/lipoyl-binding protein [Lachnospiraceae bacterium]|nr:biotin/lipoyl-binding protein [Lachnospiraceae bacterium]
MEEKTKKTLKRTGIIAAVVVGVGAGIYGGLVAYRQSSRKPVRVYPVQSIATTADSFGLDADSWYGSVASSNVQSVYVSGTEEIRQVFVTEGQQVKTGDPLLAYDTTLSAIKVDKADNDLQKQKSDLKKAQDELTKLQKTKPVEKKAATAAAQSADAAEEDVGAGDDNYDETYDNTYANLDDHTYDSTDTASSGTDTSLSTSEATDSGTTDSDGTTTDRGEEKPLNILAGAGTKKNPYVIFVRSDEEVTEDQMRSLFDPARVEIAKEETMELLKKLVGSRGMTGIVGQGTFSTATSAGNAGDSEKEEGRVYAIFRTYENDDPTGTIAGDNGMLLILRENRLSCQWLKLTAKDEPENDPDSVPDVPVDPDDVPVIPDDGPIPDDDNGGGGTSDEPTYTKAELQAAIAKKKEEVRDLTIKVKLAEISVREMKEEVSDGVVRSKIDGVVKNVMDPNDAYKNNKPVFTVTSGSGGYKIQVEVGELSLGKIRTGDPVMVQDFQTGNMADGTIEKISDMPSTNTMGWSNGNPNVSYYTCTVEVGGDAGFSDTSYLQVTPTSVSMDASGSFYLEKMLIRKDAGGSYVYVRGKDGRLSRRSIRTGRIMYDYCEIKGGLGMNDYIAFPYGNDVVEGAKTKKTEDVNALYGGEEAVG